MQKPEAHRGERKAVTFLQGRSVEKVLGMVWDSSADRLSFKVACDFLNCQEPIQLSKRKILSQVVHICGPIGSATAFLTRAKIGLQELWKRGINWND